MRSDALKEFQLKEKFETLMRFLLDIDLFKSVC